MSGQPSDPESGHYCPSAAAESPEARVFGVVLEVQGSTRVEYLARSLALTPAMQEQLGGLHPGEVFRLTSSCVEKGCRHFSGSHCRLGARIAKTASGDWPLPDCAIREGCRWFAEQGLSVCGPCSSVVTERPIELTAEKASGRAGRRHLPIVAATTAVNANK